MTGPRRPPRSALVAAAIVVGIVAAVTIGPWVAGLLSPWPDPATYAGDPRLAACRERLPDVDHVFEMRHARWFPRYFPGWTDGQPELEVDDPALVVLSKPNAYAGMGVPRAGTPSDDPTGPSPTPELLYMMCIAVGAPDGAIVHVYGPIRFESIVPVVSE
ncbi:MAG: hypothetical protein EPO00_01595 [Chloroflexota bacterium]|nr:MAG: hypothetical protein EPO00_01595 [Chloroflexota bacterium]